MVRGEKKPKLHVCCLLYRNVARTPHRRFCLPRVSPALCICRGHIWLLLPPFASPAASSFAVSPRLCFNHPTERERDVRQYGNTKPSVPVKFRGGPVKCGARRTFPGSSRQRRPTPRLLSVSAGGQHCLLFDHVMTWDT